MTYVFLVTSTLPQLFLIKRLTERVDWMSQGLKDISAAIWAVPFNRPRPRDQKHHQDQASDAGDDRLESSW
jgi:hypothetical protein